MGLLTPILPTPGDPNASEDLDVLSALTALYGLVNGNVDDANITDGSLSAAIAAAAIDDTKLASALAAILGVSSGSTVRRGKSIIAAAEARSNTSYGLLTTPDRVQNVVLPTDGLIAVAFQADWQNSVGSAGNADIFIGANQLKRAYASVAAPGVSPAVGPSTAASYRPLASYGGGLFASADVGTAHSGPVTTGQAVGDFTNSPEGGPCYIFAAAGTYDISVQFKASSGSVTARNRQLWVWTLGF
jgi:hypothetical protein